MVPQAFGELRREFAITASRFKETDNYEERQALLKSMQLLISRALLDIERHQQRLRETDGKFTRVAKPTSDRSQDLEQRKTATRQSASRAK
jgi:hypothetical protein